MSSEYLNIRYDRQIRLKGFGIESQKKLGTAKVLIIGVGGLGSPASLYLASAGVGELGLVDSDLVEISNIHRQILFSESSVGISKVDEAQKQLLSRAPRCKINVYNLRLNSSNIESIIQRYDVIIDCSDNFDTRYLVNDFSVKFRKPLVYGTIQGWTGMVSIFNSTHVNGELGPNLRCIFPNPPSPNQAPSCAEFGVIPTVCGMVGVLQAQEAIKIITGLGKPLSGRMLTIDLLTMKFNELNFTLDQTSLNAIKNGEYTYNSNLCGGKMREINAHELENFISETPDLIFLDVREGYEYEATHIDGCIHIPLGELETRNSEIPIDKTIIVYCAGGVRSAHAIEQLTPLGFNKLINLSCGISGLKM